MMSSIIEFMKRINNKCNDEFTEIKKVGCGAFGGVFKVRAINDQKIYAVKKISFSEEHAKLISRELEILFNLNYDFTVKCYNSWTENNYYYNKPITNEKSSNSSGYAMLSDPHKPLLLHIQMEYCPLTLAHVITTINSWTYTGYYIMSELIAEILECVHYLHTRDPAIIHRDIKPGNILLSYGNSNAKFIKLTDFGLSTIHAFEDQSHTARTGSRNYMAPEVFNSRKYCTKADVFSLGQLIQKMFRFGVNDNKMHSLFASEFDHLKNTTIKMLSHRCDDRPKCEQIIREKELWLISKEELKRNKTICEILNKSPKATSIEESFEEYFIQQKLH